MGLNLIPSDGGEFCFLLLGAGVGACYGFDGWTGTLKDAEFSKRARLTNLKYALTGVLLTLVADFKAVNFTTPKESLLQFYIEGFFIAAASVIGFLLFYIHREHERIRATLREYLPEDFSPALDYLLYGYNFYRSASEETVRKAQEKRDKIQYDLNSQRVEARRLRDFQSAYARQLSNALAAVGHATNSNSKAVRKGLAIQILACMRAIVLEGNQGQEGLSVNANYMVAYRKDAVPRDAQLYSRMRFAQRPVDEYEFFLVIEGYADDDGKEEFILPVESQDTADWEKRLLPGAPQAFSRSATAIVDDTENIPLPNGFSSSVAADIKRYFKGKTFRSFAALNIIHDGKKCGVVNIESNMPNIFGMSDARKREMDAMLKPFCLLLGFVINP